ncbi:LOW QUALITY PROTEIN: ubiquitin-conjugating enzyme E2 U [Glossophaga mutica]
MSCTAYFLLQRDFELKENNYEGITAFPVSEDMMEWEADIEGLQITIWQGIFFQPAINFTSEYNFVPPVVTFRTIPFHPNDQHTGQLIDFLDNFHKWNTSYTLSSILLTLQVMLYKPALENPLNLEAAQILIKDESMYRVIVQRLFHKPLQWRKPRINNEAQGHSSNLGLPTSLAPPSLMGSVFARFKPETEVVRKTDETEEGWKSDDDNLGDSWEKDVDDLVTWTNTLDTDTSED